MMITGNHVQYFPTVIELNQDAEAVMTAAADHILKGIHDV